MIKSRRTVYELHVKSISLRIVCLHEDYNTPKPMVWGLYWNHFVTSRNVTICYFINISSSNTGFFLKLQISFEYHCTNCHTKFYNSDLYFDKF